MPTLAPTSHRVPALPRKGLLRLATVACLLVLATVDAPRAQAQISLATAVSLAEANSPRIKMAEDDVAKARALLSESRDVYIPSVSVGAGLGDSYGYSPYPPTLFTFASQSLVYSASQFSYIRSARAGLDAALLGLKDTRESVAEDAVVTFAALVRDMQRERALEQQSRDAERLVTVVQDRVEAGRDTAIDLTTARLTAAQLRLSLLRATDETANDQGHLASLTHLPAATLHTDGVFPSTPVEPVTPGEATLGPGISAAFATARAKSDQAMGDARFLYRPQVSLLIQYNRYATFTDSFKQLQAFNPSIPIGSNSEVYGVQINIPLFDRLRQTKARESAADAAHALHDAQNVRLVSLDGQTKLAHSLGELRARAEVATLEQQLAQQQLDAILVELNEAPVANRPQLTPKDEQNARISEREKYLALIDTTYQLRQAEASLLRQTGQLENWLEASSSTSTTSGSPLSPTPKP